MSYYNTSKGSLLTNFKIIPYIQSNYNELLHMMIKLYKDKIQQQSISLDKIQKNIKHYPIRLQLDKILLFKQHRKIIGYALLINYWSNEYGGDIVYVDELFVKESYRSK